MAYHLYRHRSQRERLHYENDNELKHDFYTQRIIEDQEIYDTENIQGSIEENLYYIINIEDY